METMASMLGDDPPSPKHRGDVAGQAGRPSCERGLTLKARSGATGAPGQVRVFILALVTVEGISGVAEVTRGGREWRSRPSLRRSVWTVFWGRWTEDETLGSGRSWSPWAMFGHTCVAHHAPV